MDKTEYNNFKKIVNKITKFDERAEDLLHDILFQLSKNEKFNNLQNNDRRYFFIRAVMNQYNSNNSSFYNQYKKYNFEEIPNAYEVIDEPYIERPTIDWIKETLNEELIINPKFWYNKGIFELWMKHNGFIDRVHKQTKIPKYSIIDTIKEVKELINKKWKEQNGKD